jgi:hypothetical protein
VGKEDADAAVEAGGRGNVREAIKAITKLGPTLPNVASGRLTSPTSEKKTVWVVLFVTQKATTVTVKTIRE